MKKAAALVLLVSLVFYAAACGMPDTGVPDAAREPAEEAARPEKTLQEEPIEEASKGPANVLAGLSVGDAPGAYGSAFVRGFARACDGAGVRHVVSDAQGNAEKQATDVTELVALEADVIVIEPVNEQLLAAMCERAGEAGTPVVAVSSAPVAQAAVTVDTGAEAMMREAGALWINFMEEKGRGALLCDAVQGQSGRQWLRILRDAANGTEAEFVAQGAGGTLAGGANAATTLMLAYPELKSIWAADAALLRGAAAAAKAASRDDMVLGGVGCDGAIIQMMKDGAVGMVAAQFPQAYGEAAAQAAAALALGGEYDAAVDTPYRIYMAEDYALAAREVLGLDLREEAAAQAEAGESNE